ncbi:MAG: methyltransferase domain-containing protein [bacterium]|nr:methyltransferase domain-containing protein [bacterium]
MTQRPDQPLNEKARQEQWQRARDDWELVADAWEQWEPYFAAGSWPVSQKLITELRLGDDARVLDVGCGTGNPSLQTAAALAPVGSVVGVDLSERMVDICQRKADRLGLTNVRFLVGEAERLDESQAAFDAVVCRFGIMFMPDAAAGLRHLRTLLRPGGRIAISVWAPMDKNPMFAVPRQELGKVIDLPTPQPNTPGPMHLSEPGELAGVLNDAGFSEVRVEPVRLYQFARDPEDYWRLVTSLTPMLRRYLTRLTDEQREAFHRGLTEAVAQYASGTVIRMPALAQVGSATA